MIYVASSWRNVHQSSVVATLRAANLSVYDFKEGDEAFHWSDVEPTYKDGIDFNQYKRMLDHPISQTGFARDFVAMQRCDTMILVLPCGRSAHLELGWAVGQGKRTAIIDFESETNPELMYKMIDYHTNSLMDLLAWVGVRD